MRQKTYHDMEISHADMTDFRRPPYAVQRAIRDQAEQIRETPAGYVARKYGIRGDADGQEHTERVRRHERGDQRPAPADCR